MKKGKENKPYVGIFGRRNTGKSSLINKLSMQNTAIVSQIAGTTTDPVKKSYEITNFGPVVLVDTAGIDDTGELGKLRIQKTLGSIQIIDLAILVISNNTFGSFEEELIKKLKKNKCPFFIIHNKADIQALNTELKAKIQQVYNLETIDFSAEKGTNIDIVVNKIKATIPESSYKKPSLFGGLISYGDIVLLITPIDIEAPTGRMILPQVQAIRDILDNDAIAIVLKAREVLAFLKSTKITPKLVVTDSQIFKKADSMIPAHIPMTGFSVLLASTKGNFNDYLLGTPKIDKLKNGDKVLLLESCTHHVSCDDIGRVKIPRWITNFTGKSIQFDTVSGLSELPNKMEEYALVIQCGGCMVTQKQLQNRIQTAIDKKVPVTNYGMTIAYVQGIYNRAIEPFIKSTNNKQFIDFL